VSRPATAPRRLAMAGVDAAELDFIRSNSSELPNLRGILARSVLQTIESSASLLTGSVWPTFGTATNPGEHGMYHHLQWDASSMRMRRVSPDWLDFEPFWYELARRGRRVIAIDVPLIPPPRELPQGIAVLNWGSHDQIEPFTCRPRSLEGEIRRRFGRHPMGIEIPVGKTVGELEKIRDDLVRGARRKGALVRWLLDQAPWDFFITAFGETHRGGHILWPDGPGGESIPPRALLDVYRAVDEAVGDVLTAPSLADAALVLFALHGMGPNVSQEHFVPGVMDLVNSRFPGGRAAVVTNGKGRPDRPSRGIVRVLRERVPASIQNRIARLVPASVRDEVMNQSVIGGVDWTRTPGFDLVADMYGYLRLNVRGRERDGVLERDGEALPRYVAWVRDCFESLRIAGSDEPLVGAVHWTGDVFPGARLDHLPDMVVTWSGQRPAERIESALIGPLTAELATGRSGNHLSRGFCAAPASVLGSRTLTDGRGLAAFAMEVVA
jgi:predicted AlkP superfamily phosphohydrolase/phosphomutase